MGVGVKLIRACLCLWTPRSLAQSLQLFCFNCEVTTSLGSGLPGARGEAYLEYQAIDFNLDEQRRTYAPM